MTTTREQLKHFIETELTAHTGTQVGYDDDLLMSGLLNSLGVMRLVAYAEQQFALRIPPQDVTMDHFATIEAIATYIEAQQAS